MDTNRLTEKSQDALHDAQTAALRLGHPEVDGEHLLLALRAQWESERQRDTGVIRVDAADCELQVDFEPMDRVPAGGSHR